MPKKNSPYVVGFGARLIALRKAADLTQEQLATKINASRRVIAYYEGETEHPPTTILPRLAQVLGVSADELLQENGGLARKVAQENTRSHKGVHTVYPPADGVGRKSRVMEV